MKYKKDSLNLGAWQTRSIVNGPSERFVLWLQGCPRRCWGCINPAYLAIEPRHEIAVDELTAKILAVSGIEGVTYSGGEPFLQPAALSKLSDNLRAAGLGIVCFTGYTLEALQTHSDIWTKQLLAQIDLLIDGPFELEKAAPLRWRGSHNQRLHFLTDRYSSYATDTSTTEVELVMTSGGVMATGFWPANFLERLTEIMER